MSYIELKTRISDDLDRVLNLRASMEREVLAHLQTEFPVHTAVYVDYQRGGQVYTINATVIGHNVFHNAADVCVRNNETGKKRKFDVRCYRIRKQWSGGNCPNDSAKRSRVDCGECPNVTSGCEAGHCMQAPATQQAAKENDHA